MGYSCRCVIADTPSHIQPEIDALTNDGYVFAGVSTSKGQYSTVYVIVMEKFED
jgi:hypothetical protein